LLGQPRIMIFRGLDVTLLRQALRVDIRYKLATRDLGKNALVHCLRSLGSYEKGGI